MANLPGSDLSAYDGLTQPAEPGTTPLTDADKARAAAANAMWASMVNAPVTLADLIIYVNQHPELVLWAQETKARLSVVPGAQP